MDIRLGGLELQSAAERLSREIVHNNKILFKYSGLLKLSFPFYKVRLFFFSKIKIKFWIINFKISSCFQYVNTLTWNKVVKAENQIYGYAMKLVDEAILGKFLFP